MINIGIIGIGGVGGYLAALLASHYDGDESVNISLFARGNTARRLKNKGLTLKSAEVGREINTKAFTCYEDSESAPVINYMFVAVKSYSIDAIAERIATVIDENSVIIPFQNGVDGRVKLVNHFPKNRVLDGCVYIMSRIEEPGVIFEKGIKGRTRYFYGDVSGDNGGLEEIETILSSSFNYIFKVDDISNKVWMKFSRISTISTIQTCYNINSGVVAGDSRYREEFVNLIKEFESVAVAAGHKLPDDLMEISMNYLDASPSEMTTSMQRDFYSGNRCELEGQTGYIVSLAKELNLKVPTYEKMYENIKNKLQNF